MDPGVQTVQSAIGMPDYVLDAVRSIQGQIEDLYGENAFVVLQDPEYRKLGNPGLGAEFQINDHRGVSRGRCIPRIPISSAYPSAAL